MAIRLPVAEALIAIGRMSARKPTIVKPKLNQPSDEDRFHVMRFNYPWARWGVHYVNLGINESEWPIDSIGRHRTHERGTVSER